MSTNSNSWSKWHERLHRKLLKEKNLIPQNTSILLSISGGQDSMALLKLICDLQKLYKWQIHVWHGDHGWHKESETIAKELKEWCTEHNLNFFYDQTTKEKTSTEETARNWRYQELFKTAKILTEKSPNKPCEHILTGHTGSDRAETLLLNIARGTDISGISSLQISRVLKENISLIRPLLCFSREETAEICSDLSLPIWLDPSNQDLTFSRNRIRNQIIPILEELYPGCSLRMSSLAERMCHIKEDQNKILLALIKEIKRSKGIDRNTLETLNLRNRATILAQWLKQTGVPSISTKQLEEISHKISKTKPPGSIDLAKGWKIRWERETILLEKNQISR